MSLFESLKYVASQMQIEHKEYTEGDWSAYDNDDIHFLDDSPALVFDQAIAVIGAGWRKSIKGKNLVAAIGIFTVDCWEEFGQDCFEFQLDCVAKQVPYALGRIAHINTVFHASQVQ